MFNFKTKLAALVFIICFIVNARIFDQGLICAYAEDAKKLDVKKLTSVEIKENEGGELTVGKDKIKFMPQSFTVKDGFIYAINRYEPLIAKFSIDGTPAGVIKLKHAKDNKFDARFFIDIMMDKNNLIYLLEQSTATLRLADLSGNIDNFYMMSAKEGAIVQRAWKMPGSFFLIYDKGLHNAYIRDIKHTLIREEPDKAGSEFICEADSLIYSNRKIVMLEERKGIFEAVITPVGGSDEIASMNVWKDAQAVVALDADTAGNYYFYVEKKAGSSIDVISEKNKKFELKSFAVDKLNFLDDATKNCEAYEPGKLIMLYSDGKNACLGEIKIDGIK
ncbi:MAG TPA: hypothetical protein PKK26_12750 [Candidatus Wallbacteria bacterium]|nr:hypothetical protein [Candidatus Wallbacteria bacterium]